MRYTTIIDISEFPVVYHNRHACLLYLHMVLRAGYHDEDRDIFRGSLRILAAQVGLTLSATRHALALLQRVGLLAKTEQGWKVTKWVLTPTITARAKSVKEQADRQSANRLTEQWNKEVQEGIARRRREEQKEEMERRKWLQETDLAGFVQQFEDLKKKQATTKITLSETLFLGRNQERYEQAKAELKKQSKQSKQ